MCIYVTKSVKMTSEEVRSTSAFLQHPLGGAFHGARRPAVVLKVVQMSFTFKVKQVLGYCSDSSTSTL